MFTSGNGDRSNAPNFIILLTDGESNVRADDTVPRAIDARISGATIITVGIGSDVNMLELRGEQQPTANYLLTNQSNVTFNVIGCITISTYISLFFIGIASQPHNRMMVVAESFRDVTQNTDTRRRLIGNIVDASCDGWLDVYFCAGMNETSVQQRKCTTCEPH